MLRGAIEATGCNPDEPHELGFDEGVTPLYDSPAVLNPSDG